MRRVLTLSGIGVAADWSGTISGTLSGTTDEGGADTKPFSFTVSPSEDIDFNVEALDARTMETDEAVTVDLTGTVSVSDADGSEGLTGLVFTFTGLPAGATAYGGTLSGGVLTVSDFTSFGLVLPADYSTQGVSGSTTNDGADISYTVVATSNEGSDTGNGTIRVGVEGDISVSVDEIPSVAESDATVTVDLSSRLHVAATDADASEAVTGVTVTLSGVPAGSTMAGWTATGTGAWSWSGASTAGVAAIVVFVVGVRLLKRVTRPAGS